MSLQFKDISFFEEDRVVPTASCSNVVSITSRSELTSHWLVDSIRARIAQDKAQDGTLLVTFNDDVQNRPLRRNAGSSESLSLSKKIFNTVNDKFTPITPGQCLDEIGSRSKGQISGSIFLEGPDFMVTSGYWTSDDLLTLIHGLKSSFQTIFVSCNNDSELINANSTPSLELMRFLTHLFHMSCMVLSLRPLDTGRANDVSGILSISNGARFDQQSKVLENEYLYLVSSDSVTLHHR